METYFFSSYPAEKTAEIEQEIQNAGFTVVPHPDPKMANISVLANGEGEVLGLCHVLRKLAHSIKWHGPI